MEYMIMAYKIMTETKRMGKVVAAQSSEKPSNEITNCRHKSNKINIFSV